MFKKFLSLLIITILLIINIFGSTVFADTYTSSTNINDINNHWAKNQINNYVEKNFLNGYNDNTFKPNNYIKRAEFVKIVNMVFGFVEKTDIEFSDVKVQDWFYDEVSKASFIGYIKGYSDGTFKPNNYITRQEAATIIARLHELDKEELEYELSFTDKTNISNWAINNIKAVVNKGYVNGYKDGSFKPLNNITRAESVVLISRVAGNIFNISGDYGKDEDVQVIDGNVTVSKTGVNLSNLHIKGDLYLTEGIGDGEVCLNNVTVDGKTIVKGGGPNSIVIMNSDLNIIIVNTKTGEVRVVAKGNTNINNVVLTSSAKLEEERLQGDGFEDCTINVREGEEVILIGDFEEVEINTPNINVDIQSGSIQNIEITEQAQGTEIEVSKDASIEKVTIKAPVEISGEGEINEVKIHSEEVVIEQEVEEIQLTDDVQQAVIDGEIYTDEPTHSSSGSSTTAPTVGGVENNQYYNVNVIPTYNKGTATLEKDGGQAQEFTSGTEISEEGSYVLIATYSGKSTTVSFTIDKTAPDVPVIETTSQTVNADTINIEGTAEVGAIITIIGGKDEAIGTADVQGNFTVSIQLKQNDINELNITAIDNSENESPPEILLIFEDSIAPDAPIISIVPETLTNGEVTVTIIAEEDATIYYIKSEDNDYSTYSDSPFQVSQNTTVSAYAVDLYENQSDSAELYIGNIDKIPPVITINGSDLITTEALEVYVDLGATAVDDVVGEVEVTSTSSVNTSVVGTYEVTYTATDTAGNTETKARTIEVVDTVVPVITILGDNPITVEKGSDYSDLGATAIDEVDGPIEVTSTSSVDHLTVGIYTVTYSAIDLSNNEAIATRKVNVEDTIPPEVPVIETTSQTVNSDTINIEGTAEVGAIITIIGGKDEAIGTADVQGNFTVSVNLTQDAVNTLRVTAKDEANNESNEATVVINENTVPVANSINIVTNEDTTKSGILTAIDVDNDNLTFSKVTDPSHGTVTVNVDGTYTYEPELNYNGPDNFKFKANDGLEDSEIATVTITINSINDIPVANNDIVTINEDTEVIIDVLANDSDIEGDNIFIYGWSLANHGTVNVLYDINRIKYTPNQDYYGEDIFLYTIKDNYFGEDDAAVVIIKVNSINDEPTVVAEQETQTGNATPASNDGLIEAVVYTANMSAWFDDVDIEDTLTYEVISATDNAAIPNDVSSDVNISGENITYTPQATQAEKTVLLEVKAYDGTTDSTSNVAITVTVGALPAGESSSDTTPPTVTFNIEDGATGVPLDQQIVITFDEPVRNIDNSELTNSNINSSGIFAISIDGEGSIPYTATINEEKTQITVTPDDSGTGQLIEETGYIITINNLEDYSSNPIAENNVAFYTVYPLIVEFSKDNFNTTTTEFVPGDIVQFRFDNTFMNILATTITAIVTSEADTNGISIEAILDNNDWYCGEFQVVGTTSSSITTPPSLQVDVNNGDTIKVEYGTIASIATISAIEQQTIPSTMGVNVEFGSIEIELSIEDNQNNPITWTNIANTVNMNNSTIVITNSEGDEIPITVYFSELGDRVDVVNNTIAFTGEPGLNGAQTGDFDTEGLLEGFIPYGHDTVTVNINGIDNAWNLSAAGIIPYLDTNPTKGVDNYSLNINVEYESAYETENGALNLTVLDNNSIDLLSAISNDYLVALSNKVLIAAINGTDEYMYVYAMTYMPLENVTSLSMTYDSVGDKFNISATRSEGTMVDSIMTLFFLDGSTGTVQDIIIDLYGEETGTNVEVDYLPMVDGIEDNGESTITISFDTPMDEVSVETINNYQYISNNETNITSISYSIENEEATITLSSNVTDGDEFTINITEGITDSNGFELMKSAYIRNNNTWEETMMDEPMDTITLYADDQYTIPSTSFKPGDTIYLIIDDYSRSSMIGSTVSAIVYSSADPEGVNIECVDPDGNNFYYGGFQVSDMASSMASSNSPANLLVDTINGDLVTVSYELEHSISAEIIADQYQLEVPITDQLTWDGYTATFNDVNSDSLSGTGVSYTYEIKLYNNYKLVLTAIGNISEGIVTYDFNKDIIKTGFGSYTYKVNATSTEDTIINSVTSQHSNVLVLTSSDIDVATVSAAKTILATKNTLNPIEGTDTNVVAMAQALVDAEVDGVTVTLKNRTGTHITLDGTVTYDNDVETAGVTFNITRNDATDEQEMTVIIPATQEIN